MEEIQRYNALVREYQDQFVAQFDKNDFDTYVEVLFSAHSCLIEGNSFTVDESRALKELDLSFIPENKPLFHAFEMLDHFKAYKFVFSDLSHDLTEEFLKETHRILTENTIKFATGTQPGEYTTVQMMAGDTVFMDFEEALKKVPFLLEQTNDAVQNALNAGYEDLSENVLHPVSIAAQFHKSLIYLHPFRDGNGRLARLMSNFILAKCGLPLVIIKFSDKKRYIDALKAAQKHRDNTPVIHFWFEIAIRQMEEEMAQKKLQPKL